MSFSNLIKSNIKPYYTSNIVDDFYYPTLSEAKLYQRVSAYFSSSGLDLYIDGIEKLAQNGGKLEFIISKNISEEDYNKILSGYDLLEVVESLKLAERNDRLNSKTQRELGNLAFMIAMGRARVKVALTTFGDFHDKFGIISSTTESIFFTGSMNETFRGISKNYESISVDFSWDKSDNVIKRINAYKNRFERLWNNEEPGVKVIEASELAYEEIAKYQSLTQIPNLPESMDLPTEIENSKNNTIEFKYIDSKVIRLDNSFEQITYFDRILKPGRGIAIHFEDDHKTIKSRVTYTTIENIIEVTRKRAERKGIQVLVSDAVYEFLARNKYSIEQYKILGSIFKDDIKTFPDKKYNEYKEFASIVQNEVERPLYELHLKAAFYEYQMARAANFSVPGAGKTAMILGVFAYLNRKNAPKNDKIDRILVVSPISAFSSWKSEFKAVFGNKKHLKFIDSQTSINFKKDLNLNWKISNLILVNYESLPKYEKQLSNNLDANTMLVFDEVHRVKNPEGKRALSALNISIKPKYKYVLSGTPIPNSYLDIYNFLNILYYNEYESYFDWSSSFLKDPRVREIKEINEKIYPFFWRTNKKDLKVPPPNKDILTIVEPSKEQLKLAEYIFYNETSTLAKLIRLIQASTNPGLLKKNIEFDEFMGYDKESNFYTAEKEKFEQLLKQKDTQTNKLYDYNDLDLDNIVSPKFESGIKIVESLVMENKKVIVWAIFVDTMHKIANTLRSKRIKVNLIYGGTNKSIRNSLLDEFHDGAVNVLVTNPQTLGEAISLHKKVHDAVYFEYNYNLTFMLQSRDRIHRLGLTVDDYTNYYYLQTKKEDCYSSSPGFIDEDIYNRLKEKEEIMYNAIDNKNLSISYGEDEILEAIEIIDAERMRILTAQSNTFKKED